MRCDTGSRAARPDGYTRRGDVSPVPPGLAPRTPGQWQGGVRACVGVVSAASAWHACHTTAIPDAGTRDHSPRDRHHTLSSSPFCSLISVLPLESRAITPVYACVEFA